MNPFNPPNLPTTRREAGWEREWREAFQAWQARLRDYLVEKEFLLAELERLTKILTNRVPLDPSIPKNYTPDVEEIPYGGIDNAQPGTVYAKVADLNALRVAYENLRVLTEKILARLD